MKIKIVLLLTAVALFLFAFFPVPASAHEITPGAPYWGPLLSCGQTNAAGERVGCKDFCDVLHTVQHILAFMMTLVLYALAPLMLVVSGIMYLASGASPNLRSQAKSAITGTVLGILIAVGGYAIIGTFLWIVGNGEGRAKVSWPNIECSVKPYESPFVPGGVNPNFAPGGGGFGGGGASGSW